MIPDAIFLRLAEGFSRPAPDELVLLKQQQQVLFQEGQTTTLYELALQAGFLTAEQAKEFEAVAGGKPASDAGPDGPQAPSGQQGKAPSGRQVKAPSGRQVKAPSGRQVKAPSGRVRSPSGRSSGVRSASGRSSGVRSASGRSSGVRPSARASRQSGRGERISGRHATLGASGRHPARSSSPLIPLLVGGVVVACVGAAIVMSRPQDTPEVADTDPQDSSDPTPSGEEAYLERARAMRAALFARLERGQGDRALSELDALHYEWSDEPDAAAAVKVLEEIRADFVAELERRRGADHGEDPPPPPPDEPEDPPATEATETEDPAVDAEDPAVDAEDPTVDAEDPAVDAEDPVVDAEDPGLVPGDPAPAAGTQDRDLPPVAGDPSGPKSDADVITPESMLPPLVTRHVKQGPPPPEPGEPVAPRPQDPAPADPDASKDPGDTETASVPELDPGHVPSADFARAVIAFLNEQDAELRRLADLLQQGQDPLASAARGLVAFRRHAFGEAMKLLRPAIRVDATVRDTYLRCGLFLGKFDEIRQDMLAHPDDVDPALRALVFGPFHRSYPHAAAALEEVTAEGHYRVVTDLGLNVRTLDELNGKLADATPRARETLLRRTKKKHLGLQMLTQTMDKAYAAYDKLFGIERTIELVPTVYMFADTADFAAFSRRLQVGSTENTLGYYLPHYRVLVFYEEGDPKPGELSVETQETLMHETFHQWLHLYVEDAPPWFNEGLAEYFGICRIQRTRLLYGLVPAMTGPTRLADIRESLTGEGYYEPWSIKRMLTADHRDFMSAHPGLNYAQAWSFVHYLASSKTGRARLRAYFQGLRDGVAHDTLYRRVFGDVPAKTLEEDWKAYVLKLKPS